MSTRLLSNPIGLLFTYHHLPGSVFCLLSGEQRL